MKEYKMTETERAKARENYAANIDSYRRNARRYCKKHKKEREEYRKAHLKEAAQRQNNYYWKNREEIAQRAKQKYENNWQELVNMDLITDCVICGFSKEKKAAIAFHHIDPTQKSKNVTQLMWCSIDKVAEEARKCVCLCFNCHQLYHAGDKEVVEKYNEVVKKKGERK